MLLQTKCKTIEEATEKKNKNRKLCGICFGAMILLMLLGMIPFLSFLSTIAYLAVIPTVIFLALWMLARNEEIRFQDTRCEKCGEKYDYENNVGYKVLTVNNNVSDKGEITERTKLDIICECGKCGNIHKFQRSFVTYSKGTAYNLDVLVKDYFS